MNQFKKYIELIEIKTLLAGIFPVVLATLYALYRYNRFNGVYMFLTLISVMCLQSYANVLNDYQDYKRGADSSCKRDEKVMVRGELRVEDVRGLMKILLCVALVIGIILAIQISPCLFIIGLLGTFVTVHYSSGSKPISYTPYGELVVGLTMGTLLMLTSIYIQVDRWTTIDVFVTLPTSFFIGSLLLANNICDHKEDMNAGRRTLPIVIGIDNASYLWLLLLVCLPLAIGIACLLNYLPIISGVIVTAVSIYLLTVNRELIWQSKNRQLKKQMMAFTTKIGLTYHLVLAFSLLF